MMPPTPQGVMMVERKSGKWSCHELLVFRDELRLLYNELSKSVVD